MDGNMLSPKEEDKLSMNILFKISTYFIELTELCISKMQADQIKEIRKRLLVNKDNIQSLFAREQHSNKREEQSKDKSGEHGSEGAQR